MNATGLPGGTGIGDRRVDGEVLGSSQLLSVHAAAAGRGCWDSLLQETSVQVGTAASCKAILLRLASP